jgi:NADPH:quinone reductase-like Zn-dependent oxidoreductase
MTLPALAADAVRIRHGAIGVNFVDVYLRSGRYPFPEPRIPGVEGAGVVEAVGSDVPAEMVGKRVAWAGVALGGYVELKDLPASQIVEIPDAVSTNAAGGALLRGLTTYMLLHAVGKLQPGQTVLVQGAAGGLGLILIQWAKALGARVIGTVSSAEKAALAVERGLDHAIDYRKEDFVAVALAQTGGVGVDLVVDGIGGETLLRSIAATRPGGIVASIGQVSGEGPPANTDAVAQARGVDFQRASVLAWVKNPENYLAAAKESLKRIADGMVIDIAGTLPLAQVGEAHKRLEAGEVKGALVLVP